MFVSAGRLCLRESYVLHTYTSNQITDAKREKGMHVCYFTIYLKMNTGIYFIFKLI